MAKLSALSNQLYNFFVLLFAAGEGGGAGGGQADGGLPLRAQDPAHLHLQPEGPHHSGRGGRWDGGRMDGLCCVWGSLGAGELGAQGWRAGCNRKDPSSWAWSRVEEGLGSNC